MKRLIPLLLLLCSFASPTFSQAIPSDSVKIWISPEQEAKVFQDRAILAKQTQIILAQEAKIDSLNKVVDSLIIAARESKFEAERMAKQLYRDSAKISQLHRQIEYSNKVIASKDIAIKKWKDGYYDNLKFRKTFVWNSIGQWLEITGAAALFGAAVYVAMILL